MTSNPYQSPESNIDRAMPGERPKKFGYFQVSLGYALLGTYVFVAWYIAQVADSSGRFDPTVALEYSLWLAPFAVLIPLLSWLAFRNGNQRKTRINAAILFFIFLACSSLIVMAVV